MFRLSTARGLAPRDRVRQQVREAEVKRALVRLLDDETLTLVTGALQDRAKLLQGELAAAPAADRQKLLADIVTLQDVAMLAFDASEERDQVEALEGRA